MEFMVLTERVQDGKNFSVCDEQTGVAILNVILREADSRHLRYEVSNRDKKHFDLIINAYGQLTAHLDKIGQLNILFINDNSKLKEIPLYFWNDGTIVKPPMIGAELVCEQNGNYLFIVPNKTTDSNNLMYATKDEAVSLKDFVIINHEGDRSDCQFLLNEYNLKSVNIANVDNDVKIYSTNKNNQALIFDLGFKLLSKKELQNEKV